MLLPRTVIVPLVLSMWPILSTYSFMEPRQRPAIPPSSADFYVHHVPSLKADMSSPLHIWAGHISADPAAKVSPATAVTAQLFFLLTKARRTADKERLIIWLNGGPGCSSFDGLMMEVGPWRMDGKDSLKQLSGGWEEYANVLYLDQPPGTGFSYTSSNHYLSELDTAADFVVEFLENWYQTFPEYKDMDTYIAGESFAGQYIPYIADAILKSSLSIPLKGAAIGNGWIDPVAQYPAYVEFAVKENLLNKGSKEYMSAMDVLDRCQKVLNSTNPITPHILECEAVMGSTVEHLQSTVNGKTMCLNVYDIRLSDTFPACGMNWPPDLAYVTPYLRRDDVRVALHVPKESAAWKECRGTVGVGFRAKNSRPSVTLIPSIIERGVPVMLFHGDQDLICNYIGAERLIENMAWNGYKGFNTSMPPLEWSVNGSVAGEWTTQRNLTYVKIFHASHMVGFDVPHVAHDLILRFMGVDFSKIVQGGGAESTAHIPSTLGNDVKPTVSDAVSIDPGSGSQAGPGAGGGLSKGDTSKGTLGDDNKALWQTYSNVGATALVLVLIALAIGVFFHLHSRRSSKASGVSLDPHDHDEENIPLTGVETGRLTAMRDDYRPVSPGKSKADGSARTFKKKGRTTDAEELQGSTVFDIRDSDEDEEPPQQ